jgi:hypothetical protein
MLSEVLADIIWGECILKGMRQIGGSSENRNRKDNKIMCEEQTYLPKG